MRRRIRYEEELEADSNYQFSEADVQFIRELNEKLRQEEKRFLAFRDMLELQLKDLCLQRDIDDFNDEEKVYAFAIGRKCNACYGVRYGEPIWEGYALLHKEDKEDRNINWNELEGREHPLSDIPFCYTMHCVVFHSDLLWEDILSIEDVWLETAIDYQFLSNDRSKERFYEINKERIERDRLIL